MSGKTPVLQVAWLERGALCPVEEGGKWGPLNALWEVEGEEDRWKKGRRGMSMLQNQPLPRLQQC